MTTRQRRTERHPLVGLYFHTFITEIDDIRQVQYQGCIKAIADDGVLVQLFEWWAGEPSNLKWLPRADVAEWALYATCNDMNEAYTNKWAAVASLAAQQRRAATEQTS